MSAKAKVKVQGDRLVLEENPKLLVHVQRGGKGHAIKKFVHSNGKICGDDLCREIGVEQATIDKLLDGVQRVICAGYEPRLSWHGDDAVRFHAMVNGDIESLSIVCATMGAFRKASNKVDFDVQREGETITREEAREMDKAAKSKDETICVTPDTMITCWKCGAQNRVGKVLSASK